MFHAIKAFLSRKVHRIRNIGADRANAIAAAHGWQAWEIKPGTWRYRDPRFDQRQQARLDTSNLDRPASSRANSDGGS